MSGTAKLTNYRQSPRKVRLLAGLVRGKAVANALVELEFANKRAAHPVTMLLRSAIANAKNAGDRVEDLIVKDIRVDKGIVLKRMMPRARGSANPIWKRSSHIIITVAPKIAALKAGKDEGADVPVKKTTKTVKAKAAKPKAKKAAK